MRGTHWVRLYLEKIIQTNLFFAGLALIHFYSVIVETCAPRRKTFTCRRIIVSVRRLIFITVVFILFQRDMQMCVSCAP